MQLPGGWGALASLTWAEPSSDLPIGQDEPAFGTFLLVIHQRHSQVGPAHVSPERDQAPVCSKKLALQTKRDATRSAATREIRDGPHERLEMRFVGDSQFENAKLFTDTAFHERCVVRQRKSNEVVTLIQQHGIAERQVGRQRDLPRVVIAGKQPAHELPAGSQCVVARSRRETTEQLYGGVEWLKAQGASVIGLETMPRTMDNIGFYSRLGFLPGRLTITTTIDAAHGDAPVQLLSRLTPRARDDALTACRELVSGLLPGYDYTREITLTADLALGDTALLYQRDHLVGFALAHNAPLVEGRVREELRVLKLAVTDEAHLEALVRAVADFARRGGTRRVALRLQGEFLGAYRRLIALGGHVRWTDLRMSLMDYEEKRPERGLVLSNWEI